MMWDFVRAMVKSVLDRAIAARKPKPIEKASEQIREMVKDKLQDLKDKGQIPADNSEVPYKVEPPKTVTVEDDVEQTQYDVYTRINMNSPDQAGLLHLGKLAYQAQPQIGATVNAPTEYPFVNDMIVHTVDPINHRVILGPRKATCEQAPLMEIDLHHKVLRCKRCQKVEIWEVAPLVVDGQLTFDWPVINEAVKKIAEQNHIDCERPICLN